MKKLWATSLLIFMISMAFGQSIKKDMVFPRTRIGITPSALVNYHPAVQVSFDRGISDKVNFAIEGGYIFTSPNEALGIRARVGLEGFLARSSWVSLTGGFHVNYRYTANFVDVRTPSRNQDFDYVSHNARTDQTLLGFNLSENLMFKLSKRLYLEFGTGLGITSNFINSRGSDPNNTVDNFLRNSVLFVTGSSSPYFYTHLNLSYAIGR